MAKGFKDNNGKFRPTESPRKRATKFFTQNPNLEGSNPDIKKASELKEQKETEVKTITAPSKAKIEDKFNKDFKESRFSDPDSPPQIKEAEKESYMEGYDRGIAFADGATELLFDLKIGDDVTEKDLGIDEDELGFKIVKTKQDLRDIVAVQAFESEENDRQFSPFEFQSKTLQDREDILVKEDNVKGEVHPEAFDAFQEGVGDGVGSYLELFYDLNPRFKGHDK